MVNSHPDNKQDDKTLKNQALKSKSIQDKKKGYYIRVDHKTVKFIEDE